MFAEHGGATCFLDGGKKRPASHSGKRNKAQCLKKLSGALQNPNDEIHQQVLKLQQELDTEKGKALALQKDVEAEQGKTHALQQALAAEQGKTQALSDLSQKLQLDVEWLTGLKRSGVSAPSVLRRRLQREGSPLR